MVDNVNLTYTNVLHCISYTAYCLTDLSRSVQSGWAQNQLNSRLSTTVWRKSQRNFHSEHKRFTILCKMKLAWGYMTISLHILVLCMFGWFYRFCLLNQFVIQCCVHYGSHELTTKNVWFCKQQEKKIEFHYSSMFWSTSSKFKPKVYKILLKDANVKTLYFIKVILMKKKKKIWLNHDAKVNNIPLWYEIHTANSWLYSYKCYVVLMKLLRYFELGNIHYYVNFKSNRQWQ